MSILLTVHNVGFIVSAIATIGLCLFLFLNNTKSAVTRTMAFTTLFVAVFIISHVAGVNVADPNLSREILMFNLSLFIVGVVNVHSMLAFTNEVKQNRFILILLYSSAILFCLLFILKPYLFLLPSVPKLYFPNYYVPGILNWVRIAFLYGICIPFMVCKLATYRKNAQDVKVRKQTVYYISAIIFGYGFGFVPNFLVYDIPVDPVLGMSFMVFAAVPMIYGSIKYELFDVKVVAKQAFLYGVTVATLGAFIALFNFFNQWLLDRYPLLPWWITPIVISLFTVIAGVLVWNKLRESDLMKYEFITTATHKFRTPLTHIKWATDNLLQKELDTDSRLQVDYIRSANSRLVELTDTLVNASESDENDYVYQFKPQNFSTLVESELDILQNQISEKRLRITKDIQADYFVIADENRINFVIQTILENAINYTEANGDIAITIRGDKNKKHVTCAVKDSGIGIAKEEMPFMFTKFFRGSPARRADTEGMGIGLFVAKRIIGRHNGKLWAESEGAGKGATLSFSLPIAK